VVVNASNVDNLGDIYGGRVAANVIGNFNNNGVIAGGDSVFLGALSLYNSATIYSGGDFFIAGQELIENKLGNIFSDGNMIIRGNNNVQNVRSVKNLSGTIEAKNDLLIFSDGLRNERNGFEVKNEVVFKKDIIDPFLRVDPISSETERYCGSGNNGGGCRNITTNKGFRGKASVNKCRFTRGKDTKWEKHFHSHHY
jgi:hypothetical protein